MGLTFNFIHHFATAIFYLSPLLISILFSIVLMGFIVRRIEGWTRFDAIYYAFITALTVGYGDFTPTHKSSKLISVFIAFAGIIFTGLLVALALYSVEEAFKIHYNINKTF